MPHLPSEDPPILPIRSGSWRRNMPWILTVLLVAATLWMRSPLGPSDQGLVNVLTYVLMLVAWCLFVVGLMMMAPRRVWITVAVMPVLLLVILLSLFRLERVDSEINPVLGWRWRPPPTLPQSTTQYNDADETDSKLFEPRETDFVQFLGKYRDASIANTELETDWEKAPPKVLWKQQIGPGWSGFVVQGDAAFTMEQRESEEWITCYDINNGHLVWKHVIPGRHFHPLGGSGPRATPTLYDGKLYAVSAISQFVCLNAQSGQVVWAVELNKLAGVENQADLESSVAWGRSGSPLIVDDKVIVPLGGDAKRHNALIALDRQTGKELWRTGNDQISYSSPVLADLNGTQQILIVTEKFLSSHAPADGQTLWQIEWPSSSSGDANVSQPIAVDNSRVLVSKGYGGGAQLIEITKDQDQWQTKVLWKNSSVLRTKFTSCIVRDEFAFGLSDGTLECVNLNNGKRAWKQGRFRHGQVLLVGSNLLITAENGDLAIVAADPREFRQLATLSVIGDVSWNTPALSGNRLLMRNAAEAACVILPLKEAP